MRRFLLTLTASALLAAGAAPAQAAFDFDELDVTFTEEDGGPAMQAGSHPFAWDTTLSFETKEDEELGVEVPDGSPRDLTVAAIPGLAGNPSATPRCTTLEFLGEDCPMSSQIGVNEVIYGIPETIANVPVYNLTPPPGVAAKIGFTVAQLVPVAVEAGVNPNPPYNVIGSVANISQALPFFGATLTIWGFPADPAHNSERSGCVGECAAGLAQVPFLTAPRACEGPLTTFFEARPWEDPGLLVKGEAVTHDSSVPPTPLGFGGCTKLGFAPQIAAQTTSKAASSPTGLDFDLEIDNEGLTNPDGIADSDIKKAVVTLPKGVTANPSLAEGLATCSPGAFAAEAIDTEPGGNGCPEASKIGTLETETPLLPDEVIKGNVYIASQNDNPFNSLLALYMVIRDRDLGILVKLAGKVEPDPKTGQLTTTFGEPGHELPQLPVSRFHFHFREGGRSPLIAPPSCDSDPSKPGNDPFVTTAEFTPWANPAKPLTTTASFEITRGVGGGDCPPPGTAPFDPGFSAGSINNEAGSYSPFYMRLTRRDGDQDLTRFSAKLPPGMVAKLAGVSQCPAAAIAAAKAKTGRQELASPSCPASSEIGDVIGGAGAGAQLTYVPGKIYLAGPYNGAPLSVVAIVPAVAGPFDVGTVITQQAIVIDPRSAEVRVDGSRSDPIPHILAGIPLAVRDIRVFVDRPQFTLNPTSCERFQALAELWGGGFDVFSSADDSPVTRTARFQAANCASLAFKPKLSLRLKGGTHRGDNPALRGVFKPRAGDANLEHLVLRLPRSAFLDQGHIRTICTRVQFAANTCPPGAIYGKARAFTPLLDDPLEGPVYLRSSNHNLPDVVADLHGLVDVEAVGRVDSKRGGIRITFEDVPDAPITQVIVDMQGGKKGLVVNSQNLCAKTNRANVQTRGHNGRRHSANTPVKASGCKGKAARSSRR
jgi:hypothetical protein